MLSQTVHPTRKAALYCSDECKSFMLGTMKRNPGLLDNNPTTETECRSWVDSKLRKEKFLKLGYNVEGKTEDILAIETGLGCIWGGVWSYPV